MGAAGGYRLVAGNSMSPLVIDDRGVRHVVVPTCLRVGGGLGEWLGPNSRRSGCEPVTRTTETFLVSLPDLLMRGAVGVDEEPSLERRC
jgi:hypothetical protein